MNDASPRIGRADAVRNRARLLAAARSAFASAGLQVPMRRIARQAGLGVATAYRHFSTQDDLVQATLAAQVAACAAVADRAAGDPDAGRGLNTVVLELARQQGLAGGFLEALMTREEFAEERERHRAVLDDLVGRAVQQRALAEDVTVVDVRIALTALRTPTEPDASRRLAVLLLRGLRTPG